MIWTSPVQSQMNITDEISISYYWLIYPLAFLLVFFLTRKNWPDDQADRLKLYNTMIWGWLGVLIGARLGYVLFYGGPVYLNDPQKILDYSTGGMSFHGAAVGLAVATAIYLNNRESWLFFMDRLCLALPWAILLGRLGNYLNGELPGRATDQTWGLIFPQLDLILRHPSTLYSAAYEGLVLGVWMAFRKKQILKVAGRSTLEFVVGYGVLRFAVEFFREPDPQLGFGWIGFTWGQWLCVIFVLAGSVLIKRFQKS